MGEQPVDKKEWRRSPGRHITLQATWLAGWPAVHEEGEVDRTGMGQKLDGPEKGYCGPLVFQIPGIGN